MPVAGGADCVRSCAGSFSLVEDRVEISRRQDRLGSFELLGVRYSVAALDTRYPYELAGLVGRRNSCYSLLSPPRSNAPIPRAWNLLWLRIHTLELHLQVHVGHGRGRLRYPFDSRPLDLPQAFRN